MKTSLVEKLLAGMANLLNIRRKSWGIVVFEKGKMREI